MYTGFMPPAQEDINQGQFSSSSVKIWNTSTNITLAGGKVAPGMNLAGSVGQSG